MAVRRRPALVAGAVGVALVLAACSGVPAPDPSASSSSPEPSPTAPGSSEPADAPLEPTGWRSTDRADLTDGGTLTLAVDALPANYVLFHPDSATADDNLIAPLVVPAFIAIGADGSWTPDPDYVESLEVTSRDPQVVELRINPDAVWSDGTPITYRDIEANWTALSFTDPDYTPLFSTGWDRVASVERGADDRDVLITFVEPTADWPGLFQLIYPAWSMDTPEHFATAWASGPMTADGEAYVSGGPFVVTSIDPDGQVLTFGRNPQWWGDEAKLDSIVFRGVPQPSRGSAFANGEIDVVDVTNDVDALATASQRRDAVVQRSLSTAIWQLALNGVGGPFEDLAARKAFAVALDRSTLAAAYTGGGTPAQLAGSLVFAPGQHGYVDHLGAELTGNPDDALAILADAGYEIGTDGVATKDGERLTARFVVPDDRPAAANLAELVRQQTAPAGFDIEIVTVPGNDFYPVYVNADARDFDIALVGTPGSPFPLANAAASFYPADSPNNLGGVSDDALGEMFTRAGAELDPDAAIALVNEIDETITHLFTSIPLFMAPWAWGVRADLANYGPTQFETTRWQDVGLTADSAD